MGLERLQTDLETTFVDLRLLQQAMTHSSFRNELRAGSDYERLEFLGDAVLGMLSAEWLFRRHPDRPEGELAKLKSYLVSAPVLADFAHTLALGSYLRLGVGEERSGGRDKPSILADAVEALLGAIYLDQGLEAARPLVERILTGGLEARHRISPRDAKTRLQELTQARGLGLPRYRLSQSTGPDHAKVFHIDCLLSGEVLGSASGRSKKAAEQAAASVGLAQLEAQQKPPAT